MKHFVLFVLTAALALGASITIDDPFTGVRHYHSLHTVPRPLNVHIVQFDLRAPGVSFGVRPPGLAPHENSLKTVKTFLSELRQARPDACAAINGSFFGQSTEGVVSNSGLVVSDGTAYSSFDSWDGLPWPAVHIASNNVCNLVQRPAPSYFGYETMPPLNLYNAISGGEVILSNGVNVANHPGCPGDPFSMHPRTAIGFSPNKVYFVTVDGRQTGISEGVTTSELADLLLQYGVKNAVNLDGGGSTTLVFADSSPRVVNVPMSSWNGTSTERAVAACWAAFAQPQTGAGARTCVLANFETLDQNTFSQGLTASGSTYGVLSGSQSTAVVSDGYKSRGCQKLTIADDPVAAGGWFVRHLSGSLAKRSQNRICPAIGYVGFYAKTASSGVSAAIAIDNSADVTADRGILRPLIADGRWHCYEWNLTDPAQWQGWANGDGIIDSPDFTVDSIQCYGPDSDCVIYLDTIAHCSNGSIQSINLPYGGIDSGEFISEPFDTYPDGGTGWSGNWAQATASVQTAAMGSSSPVSGGGSYLTYRTNAAGTNGNYRDFAAAAAGLPHTVVMHVRVDSLGVFWDGTNLSDRLQIYGETGSGTSDAGTGAAWLIMASPNFKTPAGAPSGNWQVYNGARNGAWSSNYMVNSGIPVMEGGVYTLRVTVYPATQSYDVEISEGTNVFTRADLGFRTGNTTAPDRLVLSNKIRATGSGNQLGLSYDSIRIYGTGVRDPYPAAGQNEIPAADLTLRWKSPLTPDPQNPDTVICSPAVTGYYVYLGQANNPDLGGVSPVFIDADVNGDTLADESVSYVVAGALQTGATYYWRVDQSLGASGPGDQTHLVGGSIWSFQTELSDPVVNAGQNIVTWLNPQTASAQLDGEINWYNARQLVQWTAASRPPESNVQFSDSAIDDPVAVFDKVGTYVLRLRATDVKGKTGDDTLEVNVFEDSCRAAQSLSNFELLQGDLNTDCRVDFDDLILLVSDWLKHNCLTDNYRYREDEDGYDLWLRYPEIVNRSVLEDYRRRASEIVLEDNSDTLGIAGSELERGLDSMLGQETPTATAVSKDGAVVVGTPQTSAMISNLGWSYDLSALGPEGYVIRSTTVAGKNVTAIASIGKTGALYGTFHFMRLLQTQAPIENLNIVEKPLVKLRILNHWDSLKGTYKSIYSGPSIWKWDELPDRISPRYVDYGRANASIGINATVVNSLGADPVILTDAYIAKTRAIADVLRPYGIRVYLSANFAAPMLLGGLATADPLDGSVRQWWTQKVDEIYAAIPDFGGFLVKADSEGMPGPAQYGRDHAQGANMLAEALAPHGGIVMWRAFVYGSEHQDPDRIKQAYEQFVPLDGKFNDNVLLQVKNGPLDFQPREPVMPLYGAMPNTPLMMEFEIRQEYLGASIHLVYLAPMWEEVLKFDTFACGPGSTVGKIVDDSLYHHGLSGIAGVANTGSDANWCGHHFAQSDWYCFGRQAWNHALDSRTIAEEWARMTFTNEPSAARAIVDMMMGSHEACVNYMTPLGLHVLCAGDHYNPAPANRLSYHHADAAGLGYDRTLTGSNGTGQYLEPYRTDWNDITRIPEKYLCWFHHVPWDHRMSSGRTFWDELCFRYQSGAAYVDQMISQWQTLEGAIDTRRYHEVLEKLTEQQTHARLWRDSCIDYFGQCSGRPVP